MKMIQTFYLDPSKNITKTSMGWNLPFYNIISWTLSCLQLHKYYNAIALYTNTSSAKFFSDILQLPYKNIYTLHDDFIMYHHDLWALPKIYTYSLQEEPFLHIDGDVFIFRPFSNSFLKKGLIAQNEEKATEYYTSTQKGLIKYFSYFPISVEIDFNKKIPIKAINAGIIGGSDVEFIHQFSKTAFEYVKRNIMHLNKINTERFNVFFEQHLFLTMAKEKNKKISYLFNEKINDNEYQKIGNIHEVPCHQNYIHLLGHFKRDEKTCLTMTLKLQELYPDYFCKIIRYFHDNHLNHPYSNLLHDTSVTFFLKPNKNINYSKCTQNSDYFLKQIYKINQIPSFIILKNYISNISKSKARKCIIMQNDFTYFSNYILSKINQSNCTKKDLFVRDLNAQKWYCALFSDYDNFDCKQLISTNTSFIFKNKFNWAEIYNAQVRFGINYYENIKLKSGKFINLVVQEIDNNIISIYDIDEIEYCIYKLLKTKRSIQSILNECKKYFNEQVVNEYYDLYQELIITNIKQLVIKKAIRPF